jgi:hypothetical protein
MEQIGLLNNEDEDDEPTECNTTNYNKQQQLQSKIRFRDLDPEYDNYCTNDNYNYD